MKLSWNRILSAFIFWPLCAIPLLVPLLAVPFFPDELEIHKATLFIVLVMISALAWLGQGIYSRKITIVWPRFVFLPLLLFLVSGIVSSFFSLAPGMSWLGLGGADYTSIIMMIALVLFVFLLPQAHYIFGKRFFLTLIHAVIAGALLIVLGAFLSFAGLVPLRATITLGSPNALGFYLGAVTILWIALFLYDFADEKRPFFWHSGWLIFLGFIASAFALDAWALWISVLVALLVVLGVVLARPAKDINIRRFIPAALLFAVAIFGWLLPPFLGGVFPAEYAPSFSASINVLREAWDGLPLVFGTGPGTYAVSYAQYHAASLNATPLWNILFDRAYAHILTIGTTMGLFGLLSYLGIVATGLLVFFEAMTRGTQIRKDRVLGIGAAWSFLLAASFVYASNTTLTIFFFLFLGLLVGLREFPARTYSFEKSARASLMTAFGLVGATVTTLIVLFVSITRYSAETAYARALSIEKNGGSIDEVVVALDAAASRNQWNDLYYRELSVALLTKAGQMISARANEEEIRDVLSASINAAVRSTDIAPNTVANWEVRGSVYREVAFAVANAADFSIGSFRTAERLAPNNPLYKIGTARAYLTKADLLDQVLHGEDAELAKKAEAARVDLLVKAEGSLHDALRLKPDYMAARYFLSMVYERQDKLSDAVRSMEVVRSSNPNDVGVGMQLSLLYLRQGKNDQAKAELVRIVGIAPNYSNAHWYLSVVYEQEKDIPAAIRELEKVLEFNPDNTTVQQRLDRLKSGTVTDDAAGEVPEPLPEGEGGVTLEADIQN